MIHVQETLRRKPIGHAARKVELITIPSTLSASSALFPLSGNSPVDYIPESDGHERNATDIVADVRIRQDHHSTTHCRSYINAVLKYRKIILVSYCSFSLF
jgi:hypothetical protein